MDNNTDKQIWEIYNTIREVESTFRCLKTDLKIRPVFHQKDENTKAHINLGLMAYQLIAAIRYCLKTKMINMDWTNIVRVMNTHMISTIEMKTKTKEIHIRKLSKPEKAVEKIYNTMNIKTFPKPFRKYVVYQ